MIRTELSPFYAALASYKFLCKISIMSTEELCKAFLDRHIRDAAGGGSKREVAEAREFIEGRFNPQASFSFLRAWEAIGVEEDLIKPVIEDFVLMDYNPQSNVFRILTGVLQ